MGPTWDPSGANRTQVGPMLVPWILLSGLFLDAMDSYYRCTLHAYKMLWQVTIVGSRYDLGAQWQGGNMDLWCWFRNGISLRLGIFWSWRFNVLLCLVCWQTGWGRWRDLHRDMDYYTWRYLLEWFELLQLAQLHLYFLMLCNANCDIVGSVNNPYNEHSIDNCFHEYDSGEKTWQKMLMCRNMQYNFQTKIVAANKWGYQTFTASFEVSLYCTYSNTPRTHARTHAQVYMSVVHFAH